MLINNGYNNIPDIINDFVLTRNVSKVPRANQEDPSNFIYDAFNWAESEYGYDFWDAISKQWLTFIERKEMMDGFIKGFCWGVKE